MSTVSKMSVESNKRYVVPVDDGRCTGFAVTRLRQCLSKSGQCRVHKKEHDFIAYFEKSGLLLYANGTATLLRTVHANDQLAVTALLCDTEILIGLRGRRDSLPKDDAADSQTARNSLCGARTRAGHPCKNQKAACRHH